MQRCIQALLVTSHITGTFCQKIVFQSTIFTSPCTTGARSGIDTYFIVGTIGDNITELLNQRWQPLMFIQVLRTSSSQFKTICQLVVRGATCVPSPAARCGCFYNTTTDQAHFTASDTVRADDNNAIINAQWQHTNGTIIYSNKNYTLQGIYDVNAGHLTLTVAGVTGNLPSGSCSFSLTLNKSNDLELCCSNTAKPCYPQISFNGAVVTSNTETRVTYPTSQLASDGVTGNLDLSYSLCTQTGYIRGNSCSVIQTAGRFSQKIVFDNSTLISPCTTGARSAVDTYLITGTIGDTITAALYQKWQTVVYIKMLKRPSHQYETICQLFLGINTCQPLASYSFIKCECFYNTTTDQAHFTVSGTVQEDDSNAVIFVQWQHQNGTFIYSNKNYTFPEIYDVNAAQLNLTVAGVTRNLPSGSCSFSLTLNKSNDLELCCSKTAKPCYPQISFNGAVVTTNTEMCVTYPTSQLASDGVTGNLVLSYSVCNLTDYRQGSSCTVTPKPVTPGSEKGDSPPLDVGAIAGGIVAAVLVIIVIFVIVYLIKRNGATCRRKTDQNVNNSMHTIDGNDEPGSRHVFEELAEVQAPEDSHYEEIIDFRPDMPDTPVHYAHQISNAHDETVDYENTVSGL